MYYNYKIIPTSHTAHQVIICQTIMTAPKMQLVDPATTPGHNHRCLIRR